MSRNVSPTVPISPLSCKNRTQKNLRPVITKITDGGSSADFGQLAGIADNKSALAPVVLRPRFSAGLPLFQRLGINLQLFTKENISIFLLFLYRSLGPVSQSHTYIC